MNQDNLINYKVYLCAAGYEPEIRRITIDKDISHNYFYLKQKLVSIFPALKDTQFTVSWKDREGDTVRICTDEELMIALIEMESQDFKKIYVSSTPQKDNEGPIHPNVLCNSCGQAIQGFRYKCIVCVDVDLCPDCERAQNHPDHPVIRIPLPVNIEEPLCRRFFIKILRNIEHMYQACERFEKKGKGGDWRDKREKRPQRGACPMTTAEDPIAQFFNYLGVPNPNPQSGAAGQSQEGAPPTSDSQQDSTSTSRFFQTLSEQDPMHLCQIIRQGLSSFLDPLGGQECVSSQESPSNRGEGVDKNDTSEGAEATAGAQPAQTQEPQPQAPQTHEPQPQPAQTQEPQPQPSQSEEQTPGSSQTQPLAPQAQEHAQPQKIDLLTSDQPPQTEMVHAQTLQELSQTHVQGQASQVEAQALPAQAQPLTAQAQAQSFLMQPLQPQPQTHPAYVLPLQNQAQTYPAQPQPYLTQQAYPHFPLAQPIPPAPQASYLPHTQRHVFPAQNVTTLTSQSTENIKPYLSQGYGLPHVSRSMENSFMNMQLNQELRSRSPQPYQLRKKGSREESPVLDNSWAVLQKPEQGSGDTPDQAEPVNPKPSVDEVPVKPVTSSGNSLVDETVARLVEMGFTNEGWLQELVQSKNCDLDEVLQFLMPLPKPTT